MSKKKIIALIITVVLLGLILYKINWSVLIETFKLFDCKKILPVAFLYIVSLYLRGIRWKALFLNDNKYSAYNLAEIFTVGSMLNSFLPARAGDIYRAYYLGHVKQEKKMKVFGSVILERMFDGLTVFLFLMIAVILYCKQQWILNLTYFIGAFFISCMLFSYFIFRFNKIDWVGEKFIGITNKMPEKIAVPIGNFITKMCEYANSFVEGFEVLCSFKYSLITFVLSIIIWLIECYIAYLVFASFNYNLGFSTSLFVISLTSFSSMIPSTSIFLGPYQYAYILALGLYGVSKSATLAISTIHQGILMLVLTVFGGIFLLKFNAVMQDYQKKI
ncbi:flippase-like domain-containing protein [bacterium]|nr:flippase-like domain-containing protein [bacterium]